MTVPTASPELTAFAERIQQIITEEASSLDIFVIAGALIGSGIELGLRNGLPSAFLRMHFEESVAQIQSFLEADTPAVVTS